jgi:hypothetical protein
MLFLQGFLLMLAFVLLLLASFGVGGTATTPPTRFSLWCMGLACFVLSQLVAVAPSFFLTHR